MFWKFDNQGIKNAQKRIDSIENMPTQQVESITTPSTAKPAPKPE